MAQSGQLFKEGLFSGKRIVPLGNATMNSN